MSGMQHFEQLEIEIEIDESQQEIQNPNRQIVIGDEPEDRYSRFRLIPWWDQQRLKSARVMVVGAGAIGNELIKNLALLGIGNIFIVDMDTIENSNLSRSVLYNVY